jgi:hypothetical protein
MAIQLLRAKDSLLQLQQQQGNHYVQRALDLARRGEEEAEVGPEIEEAIQRARGGGQALDSGVRAQMEAALGTDFSGVRVHADAQADGVNRSLNARALTTGQDIFFRQGAYNPGSSGGRELLAHELTHVVQQAGGARPKLAVGQPGDRYEQEADRVARAVLQQEQQQPIRKDTDEGLVQRQVEEEEEMPLQAKAKGSRIQRQDEEEEEKELLQTKVEGAWTQRRGEEKDEEPIQTKIEDMRVGRQVEEEEEEEPVQPKSEEPRFQRQAEEEEDGPIQAKDVPGRFLKTASSLESRIQALSDSGHVLDTTVRVQMEPSPVRPAKKRCKQRGSWKRVARKLTVKLGKTRMGNPKIIFSDSVTAAEAWLYLFGIEAKKMAFDKEWQEIFDGFMHSKKNERWCIFRNQAVYRKAWDSMCPRVKDELGEPATAGRAQPERARRIMASESDLEKAKKAEKLFKKKNENNLAKSAFLRIFQALEAATGDNIDLWIAFYKCFSSEYDLEKAKGSELDRMRDAKPREYAIRTSTGIAIDPIVLDFSPNELGVLLIHEFVHMRHPSSPGLLEQYGYLEAEAHGIEKFLAERSGAKGRLLEDLRARESPEFAIPAAFKGLFVSLFDTSYLIMKYLYMRIDDDEVPRTVGLKLRDLLMNLKPEDARALVAEFVSTKQGKRSKTLVEIMKEAGYPKSLLK